MSVIDDVAPVSPSLQRSRGEVFGEGTRHDLSALWRTKWRLYPRGGRRGRCPRDDEAFARHRMLGASRVSVHVREDERRRAGHGSFLVVRRTSGIVSRWDDRSRVLRVVGRDDGVHVLFGTIDRLSRPLLLTTNSFLVLERRVRSTACPARTTRFLYPFCVAGRWPDCPLGDARFPVWQPKPREGLLVRKDVELNAGHGSFLVVHRTIGMVSSRRPGECSVSRGARRWFVCPLRTIRALSRPLSWDCERSLVVRRKGTSRVLSPEDDQITVP